MRKNRHYSPVIRRDLVRVLYFERRRRRIPMTRLVDELLSKALQETPSWQLRQSGTDTP